MHARTHARTSTYLVPPLHQVTDENPFLHPCPECREDMRVPVEVATQRKTEGACTWPNIPCRCEKCDISFCPRCWQRFHYGTSCDEAAAHVVAWHAFMSEHQHRCGALSQEAQLDFERRRRENEATAAVCRQCPHCGVGPVYKIDGLCVHVCRQCNMYI